MAARELVASGRADVRGSPSVDIEWLSTPDDFAQTTLNVVASLDTTTSDELYGRIGAMARSLHLREPRTLDELNAVTAALAALRRLRLC